MLQKNHPRSISSVAGATREPQPKAIPGAELSCLREGQTAAVHLGTRSLM